MGSGGRRRGSDGLRAGIGRWRATLLLGICLASAPARGGETPPAGDAAPPFVLTADTLSHDSEGETVTATGNVEISRNGRRLLADQVRYDQTADRVNATGNVVLIEPDGDAVFADTAEVTGDLREGFVQSVGVLLKDDSRLAAAGATRREGNVTELDRAVYSPCPLCQDGKGRPLWQIKAGKVVHDQAQRTITYRDATMELLGVPVAYAPFFRHPDPGVKRQSGLLAPSFGSSSELGLLVELPYYQVLGPSADLTLLPIITQTEGVVAGAEYRQAHAIGTTRLAGSATYTSPYQRRPGEEEGGNEWRGHVRAIGDYEVTEDSDAGFNLFLASDNTYLKRYRISRNDVLTNRAFLQGADNRDFWTVNGYYFQGLRESDEQGRIPIALPLAETRLVSDPGLWGSHWTVDSSLLALTRVDGRDTRRLSSRIGWEAPFIGSIGEVYRLEASVRGDAYHVEGDPQDFTSGTGEDTVGRVLPRLSLDLSWPLADVTGAWAHQIEPMAAFTVAPTGGNASDIPNEDSRDFELDETNLFEPIRFPGLDRNEGGTKVAYGVRFSSFGPRATEISGVLGQSYSFTEVSAFPEGSGVEDNLSDYVGRLDLRPSPFLDLSYRFRLGREDLEFRRNNLLATFGPAALRFNLGYVDLSRERQDDLRDDVGFDSREEIVAGVRAQVTERLTLGAQTRRDLSRNEPVANQLGLIYTHPCLAVIVGFEQSFTTIGELDEETAFLVRLEFKNLGEFETGAGLFGLD